MFKNSLLNITLITLYCTLVFSQNWNLDGTWKFQYSFGGSGNMCCIPADTEFTINMDVETNYFFIEIQFGGEACNLALPNVTINISVSGMNWTGFETSGNSSLAGLDMEFQINYWPQNASLVLFPPGSCALCFTNAVLQQQLELNQSTLTGVQVTNASNTNTTSTNTSNTSITTVQNTNSSNTTNASVCAGMWNLTKTWQYGNNGSCCIPKNNSIWVTSGSANASASASASSSSNTTSGNGFLQESSSASASASASSSITIHSQWTYSQDCVSIFPNENSTWNENFQGYGFIDNKTDGCYYEHNDSMALYYGGCATYYSRIQLPNTTAIEGCGGSGKMMLSGGLLVLVFIVNNL